MNFNINLIAYLYRDIRKFFNFMSESRKLSLKLEE